MQWCVHVAVSALVAGLMLPGCSSSGGAADKPVAHATPTEPSPAPAEDVQERQPDPATPPLAQADPVARDPDPEPEPEKPVAAAQEEPEPIDPTTYFPEWWLDEPQITDSEAKFSVMVDAPTLRESRSAAVREAYATMDELLGASGGVPGFRFEPITLPGGDIRTFVLVTVRR